MTKSDDGERMCPLCTEEMDLTDQQLKPCKCGYEICVWCWHHIMEMAEKDGTEGRCPACRASYDKERIVNMAAKCERLVAEVNTERRAKAHKGKLKTLAEERKQLANVRVIQKNLVYIVGLPPTLADVQILQRKEYFGQYGNIIKISVSRPNSGTQPANSNTISAYVTYATEEDATRCIQAVHSFVLQGKPLRACFGTTKYCHSWIRNTACSNPDCCYLHDIGSQEDTFVKNEITPTYARSRLPQTASNNSRPGAGSILPPPADFCTLGSVSSSKIGSKSSFSHSAAHHNGSPPNGIGIPVQSSSTSKTWLSYPSGSTPESILGLQRQKDQRQVGYGKLNETSFKEDRMVKFEEVPNGSLEDGKLKTFESCKDNRDIDSSMKMSTFSYEGNFSSAWHDVASTSRISEDNGCSNLNRSCKFLNASKGYPDGELHAAVSYSSRQVISAWDDDDDDKIAHDSLQDSNMHLSSRYVSPVTSLSNGVQGQGIRVSDVANGTVANGTVSNEDHASYSFNLGSTPSISSSLLCVEKAGFPGNGESLQEASTPLLGSSNDCSITSNNLEDVNSRQSSVKVDDDRPYCHMGTYYRQDSDAIVSLAGSSRDFISSQQPPSCQLDRLNFASLSISHSMPEGIFASGITSDLPMEHGKQTLPPFNNSSKITVTDSTGNTNDNSDASISRTSDASCLRLDDCGITSSNLYHSYHRNDILSGSLRTTDVELNGHFDPKDGDTFLMNEADEHSESKSGSLLNYRSYEDKPIHHKIGSSGDDGESNNTPDIFSMDFDPWSDPLSTNNSFLKLLREKGARNSFPNATSSLKSQNSESMFPFARQEHHTYSGMTPTKSRCHDEPFGEWSHNCSAAGISPPPVSIFGNHSAISSDMTPVVSRANISAPPGFSIQTRAPPPGFFSQSNANQAYNRGSSDNQNLWSSSLGKSVQLPQNGNSDDVEFIDPAILAVVRRSSPVMVPNDLNLESFPSSQTTAPRSDLAFQPWVNQSNQYIPTHENQRISGHMGDKFFHFNGLQPAWSAEHRFSDQLSTQMYFHSNNQWDQYLRNIRSESDSIRVDTMRNGLGPNNILPGSENLKFLMANPGNKHGGACGF